MKTQPNPDEERRPDSQYRRAPDFAALIKEVLSGGEYFPMVSERTRNERIHGKALIQRQQVLIIVELPSDKSSL